MFKKIVASLDLSDYSPVVLEAASNLASKFGSDLYLLHVLEKKVFPRELMGTFAQPSELEEVYSSLSEYAQEELHKYSNRAKEITGREPTIAVRQGHPVNQILEFLEETDADLIVIGYHRKVPGIIAELGAVTEKIARHSPAHVYIVKEKEQFKIKNVLAPVDFSERSKKSLEIAAHISEKFGARLSLLYVLETPKIDRETLPDTLKWKVDKFITTEGERERYQLEAWTKQLTEEGCCVVTSVFVDTGEPVAKILEYADDENVDLIVMATRGLSGLKRVLMGSVTEKVIRKSKQSVLVVRGERVGKTRFK